ncbi:hypothetical protein SUGI_1042120 [Cryptomeria japonica]|nr:hypothetical protein SUGI_1042120 [Cryptomeria japonica]
MVSFRRKIRDLEGSVANVINLSKQCLENNDSSMAILEEELTRTKRNKVKKSVVYDSSNDTDSLKDALH